MALFALRTVGVLEVLSKEQQRRRLLLGGSHELAEPDEWDTLVCRAAVILAEDTCHAFLHHMWPLASWTSAFLVAFRV